MASSSRRPPSRAFIHGLQNEVRRAINYFPLGENQKREGVDPGDLKRSIVSYVGAPHGARISLRRRRGTSDDQAEYDLRYDGELLFRVVWVPWPAEYSGRDGRWHVRRHPEATWWRDEGPARAQPRARRRPRSQR